MVRSMSTALALTFLYLSQKCRKIRPEKFNKAKIVMEHGGLMVVSAPFFGSLGF